MRSSLKQLLLPISPTIAILGIATVAFAASSTASSTAGSTGGQPNTNTNLVYNMINDEEDNSIMTFDITDRCSTFLNIDQSTQDPIEQCTLYTPVLQPFIDQNSYGIFMGMDRGKDGGNPHSMCTLQRQVCESTITNHDYSSQCVNTFQNCQQALRHLYIMMFNDDPQQEQKCNNFARKSVRAFFHDYMSNGIDGSLLSENDIGMNVGLCRYNQYINVLSDETQCDPGSIIAMSGILGYMACGVELFDVDIDVKPAVRINRPYTCQSNTDPNTNPLFDDQGERKLQFSDAQLSSNATAMEEFWYAANEYHHGRPDGEIEYSGEAAASAHAIGRVTCAPDGTSHNGYDASQYKLGFFHKSMSTEQELEEQYGNLWFMKSKTQNVHRLYQQAVDKMSSTQCKYNEENDTYEPPNEEGIRENTNDGETNINTEGGLCGMPTQFLGTVRTGGLHRVPRWVSIVQDMSPSWPDYTQYQNDCTVGMKMYIPLELLTIVDNDSINAPTSAALERFREIAWDGLDSIDSAWDSCEIGCDITIDDNKLCGGNGLENFNWESDGPTTSPTSTTPLDSPAPSSSHTKAPTSAPLDTPAPSSSPTASSTCSDSPNQFRTTKPSGSYIWRNCSWVAKNTIRCSWDGVSSICPATCNSCNPCRDSTIRFRMVYNGRNKARNCAWVGKRNKGKKCRASGARESCRETCGMCS